MKFEWKKCAILSLYVYTACLGSLVLFLKFASFRFFFLTHSRFLLFQNLGHFQLNRDELILKAVTVYEQ
jgi:hypothetical protein